MSFELRADWTVQFSFAVRIIIPHFSARHLIIADFERSLNFYDYLNIIYLSLYNLALHCNYNLGWLLSKELKRCNQHLKQSRLYFSCCELPTYHSRLAFTHYPGLKCGVTAVFGWFLAATSSLKNVNHQWLWRKKENLTINDKIITISEFSVTECAFYWMYSCPKCFKIIAADTHLALLSLSILVHGYQLLFMPITDLIWAFSLTDSKKQ